MKSKAMATYNTESLFEKLRMTPAVKHFVNSVSKQMTIMAAVLVVLFVTMFFLAPVVESYYDEKKKEFYTMKYSCQWKCGVEPSEEIAQLINYDQLKEQNLQRAYDTKFAIN